VESWSEPAPVRWDGFQCGGSYAIGPVDPGRGPILPNRSPKSPTGPATGEELAPNRVENGVVGVEGVRTAPLRAIPLGYAFVQERAQAERERARVELEAQRAKETVEERASSPCRSLALNETHPLGNTTKDPAGDAERELFSDRNDLRLPLKAPASLAGTTVQLGVTVRYQGCRAGLCFAPAHTDLVVPVKVTGRKK